MEQGLSTPGFGPRLHILFYGRETLTFELASLKPHNFVTKIREENLNIHEKAFKILRTQWQLLEGASGKTTLFKKQVTHPPNPRYLKTVLNSLRHKNTSSYPWTPNPSPTKEIPSALVSKIKQQVTCTMAQTTGPHYAAFDADGTLWDNDLGESFFKYQMNHRRIPSLQGMDAWKFYENLKKTQPIRSCLWLGQICQGFQLHEIRNWATQALEKTQIQVFQCQKEIIAWLKEQGVEVFIVTGSTQWSVEPAAELVGLPRENVLGVQTQLDSRGRLTDQPRGPITWCQGKAKALLARTQNVAPIFCSGNTPGDQHLLDISLTSPMAIQTQVKNNVLGQEEQQLRDYAIKKGWHAHHFFL